MEPQCSGSWIEAGRRKTGIGMQQGKLGVWAVVRKIGGDRGDERAIMQENERGRQG